MYVQRKAKINQIRIYFGSHNVSRHPRRAAEGTPKNVRNRERDKNEKREVDNIGAVIVIHHQRLLVSIRKGLALYVEKKTVIEYFGEPFLSYKNYRNGVCSNGRRKVAWIREQAMASPQIWRHQVRSF